MNFFYRDDDGGTIVLDPTVWIYVISTALLSGLTYLLYYLVIHHQGTLLKQLKSKLALKIVVFQKDWWPGQSAHRCENTSPA